MSIITIRPKTPTGADVNEERDRRLHMQPFTVAGYNATIVVEGDASDRQNLLALGTIAQGMIEAGSTDLMQYRDGANVVHALTPAQMHELWMKGAALISAVSRASWLLKDDPNGIPADFAEDSYWPA